MRSESRVIIPAALILVIADLALLFFIRNEMVASVGWAQVAGAIFLQLALLAGLRAWLSLRRRFQRGPLHQTDSEFSYRRQIPVTAIGLALLIAGFSLCLIYLGFVCPSEAMPIMRGRPLCG